MFEGRFFTVCDARVLPKPVQKPRWGLRILSAPSITPPALMKKSYEAYRRVWQESGHPLEQLKFPRCTSGAGDAEVPLTFGRS